MALNKIFLIDAHGFLHRNYHALPKLATSKGEEVGALYGFVNWLLKFLKEYEPQYVAACFDSKYPTFRHVFYPQYKANRPPTDETLVKQLITAREAAGSLGLKVVAKDGVEADDIIASITKTALNNNFEVIMITSDKDSYQLLGDNVKIWSGGVKDKPCGKDICKDKFDVDCAYLTDYLAIVGDSVDNVPGITGLGPKTAAELINKFGGLENIIKAAEGNSPDIKPAIIKKILAGKEDALLSKKLVILDAHAPLGLTMEDFKLNPPEPEKIKKLIERFEFKNLASYLNDINSSTREEEEGLFGLDFGSECADSAQSGVSFETAANQAAAEGKLFLYAQEGFIICAASKEVYNIAKIEDLRNGELSKLFEIIRNDKILKIGSDLKYALRAIGFKPERGAFVNCFDAALAKYCLNPSGNLGLPASHGDIKSRLAGYAAIIWDIKEDLEKRLKEHNQDAVLRKLELPLTTILLEMEINGIEADLAWLNTLGLQLDEEIRAEQEAINAISGESINVNSPKQLGVLLFERLGLPTAHKTKTGYSTDEESLKALLKVHPVAEHILKYRESAKLKSTYVDSLLNLADPSTRRVHTTFDQTGTVTGRLSSFNPNLQNIPVRSEKGRLIRRAFVAGEGNMLLCVDYSQIDLRVLAHESGDETLINSFNGGEDIHRRTAAEVFNVSPQDVTKEQRSGAKTINFGIVYGQGPLALAQILNISVKQAKEYIDAYFARYSALKKWLTDTALAAREKGYVKTMFGHIRYLPEFEASSARIASFANRAAVNTVVQGGSSDIIKKAMIDIYRQMPCDILMLLQVHDELVFEVPQSKIKEIAAWIKSKMENAVKLKVPLIAQVKAGLNWNEMKKVL
jgi:DNA polymerase-1